VNEAFVFVSDVGVGGCGGSRYGEAKVRNEKGVLISTDRRGVVT